MGCDKTYAGGNWPEPSLSILFLALVIPENCIEAGSEPSALVVLIMSLGRDLDHANAFQPSGGLTVSI